jgi:anti-sigma factor ChrR (cupin superfamily)
VTDHLDPHDLAFLDRLATAAIEPVPPPAAARARLLESIRATPQLDASVPRAEECVTVRADEGTWKTIGAGARMKRLAKDDRRVTFLLDLDPNAILPAHDHDAGEDSYVLRGSCFIGGLELATGDFHHTDAGSHHGDVVSSAEGCLLLVTVAVQAA